MRTAVKVWWLFFLVAACGSGQANLVAGQPISQAGWVGTWTCMLTTTEHCPGKSPAMATELVTFTALGDAGITTTSGANCVCNFSLDGDNASLSNGPVMCGDGPDLQFVTTAYTLNCDGGVLAGEYDGTVYQPSTGTCPATTTIDCTR